MQSRSSASWLSGICKASILLSGCWFSHTALAATTLTFCFQDIEFAPYYLGNGEKINAGRPGATIEHLQQVTAKIPGLTLKLVRFPWRRCLRFLQTGEVDAVVANYKDSRREIGAYPMRGELPDPAREFTRQQVCLVTDKTLATRWNGSFFEDTQKVIVAHQSGRNIEQRLSHRQFVSIPISSQAKALQMLAAEKVQAVSMVCKISGTSAMPADFNAATMTLLEPPLDELHGHLIFSHQFYQAQPQIAEALWAQLSESPIPIYLKYLNDESADEGGRR